MIIRPSSIDSIEFQKTWYWKILLWQWHKYNFLIIFQIKLFCIAIMSVCLGVFKSHLYRDRGKDKETSCALQKCKVLRDYENAPWQPLWLSSLQHEFMTAVGTMEDLHIFWVDEKGHYSTQLVPLLQNGCASCRQLSSTTITWATISSRVWLSYHQWLAPSQPHKKL